ncbi:ferredoxin [Streptomyces sp. NBC_01525]|uniref:Ferredoxin n=1 Tax=Streptomyces benahoarensis TaxID=2595054 RepID=A0A553YVK7_9ACTN|nr:ferredoxin [Streptomyces benahoarensis]TSB20396.1 ferredoxin [Streptomyces benahoarensis]TSB33242.1 ferredoxin [Streptomyces benahoarensis]
MSRQVEVDPQRCIGSGICAGTAPGLFVLDGPRSRPVREEIDGDDELALDAADLCPAMAITVREDGREIAPRD